MTQVEHYTRRELNQREGLQRDENRGVYTSPEVRPGPELSIIVPTYNERDNVAELVSRLEQCLVGSSWEVIFVDDDSPDGTADIVRALGRGDFRIRCIQRLGRRGLSSACLEGMLASTASYLAVMDADLQHDESLLPQMLCVLKEGTTDVVVGSRYLEGGSIGDWNKFRAIISRFATILSYAIVPRELTDPMSGFFMLRRDIFEKCVRKLSAIGFKILLDLFASSPQELCFKELSYQFRKRHAGESKLDSIAGWDYGMLLLDKLIGKIIPVRFVSFSFIGGLGLLVHLLILSLFFKMLSYPFIESQGLATGFAMTFNFVINNMLTYRDLRLRGWQWLRGWLIFSLACSLGAFANVGIASYLFQMGTHWIPAAVGGSVFGAVWNYATTAVYTWNKPLK